MAAKPVIGVDLDGTVLECRTRQEAVLLDLLPAARPYRDALWSYKREGFSTREALAKLGMEVGAQFHTGWMEHIESQPYLALDAPLPGAMDALTRLQAVADLHLITARQKPAGVWQVLRQWHLTDFFQEVVIVPPGSVEAKAMHLRSVQAKAHCGDSEVDGKAAALAGIPFWAVSRGQRSEAFLRGKTDPEQLVASLADLQLNSLGASAGCKPQTT